jgi:hypothetical protein
MNEKAMRKSKSLKGKGKTEQVALWRQNGEERARETPKAPTKVDVVGYWPNVERGGGKSGRHMERNKCLAATVTKRKETTTRVVAEI